MLFICLFILLCLCAYLDDGGLFFKDNKSKLFFKYTILIKS